MSNYIYYLKDPSFSSMGVIQKFFKNKFIELKKKQVELMENT